MPMVGMESSRVSAAATTGGTHSSTTAKHPASCRSYRQPQQLPQGLWKPLPSRHITHG